MTVKIRIGDSGVEFACASGDTLTRAALRAGIGMPYECNVGSCGTCKVELMSGEVESAWPEAPAISDRDRAKNRVLGCQSRPLTDCTIKVRTADDYTPLYPPRTFEATLTACRELTHDIREFHLQPAHPIPFRPGQYALFSLRGCAGQRAYSMSNTSEDGNWQFQIKRLPGGQATNLLFDRLQIGECMHLDGPYGVAYLREDSLRDIVCIAGGSGISPMLSIARAAIRSPSLASRQIHFFYGGRSPRDLCGEAELRALPGFGERLHYYPVVSSPAVDGETPWPGRIGLVHDQVLAALPAPSDAYEFYFAGPPPMTAAMQRLLVQTKIPYSQMHFDQFF